MRYVNIAVVEIIHSECCKLLVMALITQKKIKDSVSLLQHCTTCRREPPPRHFALNCLYPFGNLPQQYNRTAILPLPSSSLHFSYWAFLYSSIHCRPVLPLKLKFLVICQLNLQERWQINWTQIGSLGHFLNISEPVTPQIFISKSIT